MKKINITIIIMLLFVVQSSCLAQVAKDSGVHIYHGGNIITMEGDTPKYVETVVTENGIIKFVGKLKKAQKKFKNAKTNDLKGKTLLPGFIGPHLHFGGLGSKRFLTYLLLKS